MSLIPINNEKGISARIDAGHGGRAKLTVFRIVSGAEVCGISFTGDELRILKRLVSQAIFDDDTTHLYDDVH